MSAAVLEINSASASASNAPATTPETVVVEASSALAPQKALSLHGIVDHLFALEETLEMVPDEEMGRFLQDLLGAEELVGQKCDAYQGLMGWAEGRVDLANKEAKRLNARAAKLQSFVKSLEEYVLRVIRSGGRDEKGDYRRLQGRLVTFTAKANPPSTDITDQSLVLSKYKTTTVSMPRETWDYLLDSVPIEVREKVQALMGKETDAVAKDEVKADILHALGGADAVKAARLREESVLFTDSVPGARLLIGNYKLDRK